MMHRKQLNRRKNKMENSIAARCRNKFWIVFLALFVFWHPLFYGFNWFSFPGIASPAKQAATFMEAFLADPVRNRAGTVVKNGGFEDPAGKELEHNDDACAGRYIYMHDLPGRFNEDLMKECRLLNKWVDMCGYLVNMGLGPVLGNRRFLQSRGWFSTNQFSLEPIFHSRMKQYECLTNDSSRAAAVFVPYYAGFDVVRYLWDDFNASVRDSGALGLVKWLREKPEWGFMGGRDHFMVAGRITWDFRRLDDGDSSWGNKLMLLPECRNMTVLTIESSPRDKNDFAIPYPSYFHPSTADQVLQWQNRMRRQRRRTLFAFAGAPRPNLDDSIRGQVIRQCLKSRTKCRLSECKPDRRKCDNPVYVMRMFQSSDFCLQPPGDSFTRRSTFDSILAGCIPVFFTPASAYVQYLWHLPRNFAKYSVLIPEGDVRGNNASIENILSGISKSRVSAMREEVIKLIPRLVYADPRTRLERIKDAFDLTVEAVIDRVKKLRKEMREGKDSSLDFDDEHSWKYYAFGTVAEHEWDHFFSKYSSSTRQN
ncbi:PREDICTED: probable xyloglucan galactosyltransferase GT11 [Ipomoea nil]|uniref:probable xyloglucan galactosyltransferase GT11 n=1 Tax=Ipomoea nil TaxID=35883 RepID=UPI000901DA1D|nr:PREDICTED: probable xyloglucan galactosyltransferase GT11 [Ipomoea nil]